MFPRQTSAVRLEAPSTFVLTHSDHQKVINSARYVTTTDGVGRSSVKTAVLHAAVNQTG